MANRRGLGAFSRFNVFALLADQFRFLTNLSTQKPAWFTRGVVLLVAPVTFVISLASHWKMQAVGDLVGALGLLAGVFLSAFAVVFSLRVGMATRPSTKLQRRTARLMDESALTLLAAALLAGTDALWLAGVSASIPDEPGWTVSEIATAVTIAISSLVVVYFLLSVRRMHVLYTDTFPPEWRIHGAVNGPKQTNAMTEHEHGRSETTAR